VWLVFCSWIEFDGILNKFISNEVKDFLSSSNKNSISEENYLKK